MSGPSQPDPIERALEVFVYAPLGIGLWLRDLTPSLLDTVVARGKAEIDRRQEQAQQRITTARSMGQGAIAFGVPELRKRADAQLAKAEQQLGAVREQAEQFVEQLTGSRPGTNGHATRDHAAERDPSKATTSATPPKPTARAAAAPSAPAEPAPTVGATDSATARSTSSAHLPIPGYDALSASQVVERLAGLGPDELAAVRDYETEHRNRRTILGKITQLTS